VLSFDFGAEIPQLPVWFQETVRDRLPKMLANATTGVVVATSSVALLGLALIKWSWSWWRRAEQSAVLAQTPLRGRAVVELIVLACVFWALVLVVLAFLFLRIIEATTRILMVISAVLGLAFASAHLLTWLKPPPEWKPSTKGR
jgi:hypothetical protein